MHDIVFVAREDEIVAKAYTDAGDGALTSWFPLTAVRQSGVQDHFEVRLTSSGVDHLIEKLRAHSPGFPYRVTFRARDTYEQENHE